MLYSVFKKDLDLCKTDLNLWSYYCESLSSAFSSFQILNQNEIVNRIRKVIKKSPTKLLLILHN